MAAEICYRQTDTTWCLCTRLYTKGTAQRQTLLQGGCIRKPAHGRRISLVRITADIYGVVPWEKKRGGERGGKSRRRCTSGGYSEGNRGSLVSLLITVGDAAWAARHTAGCRRGRGGTLALEMREAVKPFIVPRSPPFFVTCACAE